MKMLFALECGAGFGLGHLMRCRPLMLEAGARGIKCGVMIRGDADMLDGGGWPDVELVARVDAATPPREFSRHVELEGGKGGYSWAVLDGYGFEGGAPHAGLSAAGVGTLILDDIGNRRLAADLLLNQNTSSDGIYGAEVCVSERLMGSGFALIGPEWVARRKGFSVAREVGRVVVTFGGLDKKDWTLAVARAVSEHFPHLGIDLVLGPYYSGEAVEFAEMNERIRLHIGKKDLSGLMSSADAAICGAGSTVWQACCLGLPMLAVAVVDNQMLVADTLRSSGAALCFDGYEDARPVFGDDMVDALHDLMDQRTRMRLSRTASTLVDGLGASRVLDRLLGRSRRHG